MVVLSLQLIPKTKVFILKRSPGTFVFISFGNGLIVVQYQAIPHSKVHGANMEPTWGWQDPTGPHVGHMKIAT